MPYKSTIYCFLLLIVSLIGIFCYKRLTFPFRILAWSVLVVFVLNVISQYFIWKYRNNYIILHIESLTDYLFYAATYYYIFKNRLIKRALILSAIGISVFFFINALFFQPIRSVFPTYMYYPTQILFSVFSLLLFKEMLQYPLVINITKQSVFWFNAAILFYGTTMFFILGLTNYLAEHNLNDQTLFNFWYLVIYLFHIFIAVSLLIDNKNVTTKHT
jgi:hypothetical protein